VKGTGFVQTYASLGLGAWENVALDLAKRGELFAGPYVEVPVEGGGMRGVLRATSDVISVGEERDTLRLPLTPDRAQDIANLSGGALLPTRKIVKDIWRASPVRLTPHPLFPNKGTNLPQYAEHSRLIDEDLGSAGAMLGQLTSGQKKDIVISNAYKPGRVVIYGWLRPDGTPIQPLSNIHGDFYVDYSHGVRLIAPTMTIEGVGEVSTEEVYRHPVWSALVSDEGPLRSARYPTKSVPSPSSSPASSFRIASLLDLGFQALLYYSQIG